MKGDDEESNNVKDDLLVDKSNDSSSNIEFFSFNKYSSIWSHYVTKEKLYEFYKKYTGCKIWIATRQIGQRCAISCVLHPGLQ